MNVFNYIKYYGNYSFLEKEFNEVDNLIFSCLSYVDFNNIVSKSRLEITIGEAYKIFEKTYKPRRKEMLAIKNAIKLFSKVANARRFKNIKMNYYEYVGNDRSQFSALTFKIDEDNYFVSFEGTDSLVSGWKEDCKMAYQFPVKAHVLAINYLNKHFTFSRANLIIGGHSKGGNLALVAAMYANIFVKSRIIKVYSNDGQGLLKEQLESRRYQQIESRFVHIIPNYSIVGLILRHKNNYVVIKSSRSGFLAHDFSTWQVNYDHLERDKLSASSKEFEKGFTKWLNKYNKKDRELFVNSIFDIFKENNINDLMEIKIKRDLILNVVKQSKKIDPLAKEMTIELFKIISKSSIGYPMFKINKK